MKIVITFDILFENLAMNIKLLFYQADFKLNSGSSSMTVTYSFSLSFLPLHFNFHARINLCTDLTCVCVLAFNSFVSGIVQKLTNWMFFFFVWFMFISFNGHNESPEETKKLRLAVGVWLFMHAHDFYNFLIFFAINSTKQHNYENLHLNGGFSVTFTAEYVVNFWVLMRCLL